MADIKRIKIAIKTSAEAQAGTDASVFLGLLTPTTHRIYRLPTRREEMEGGKLDIYLVELTDGPNLDELQSVLLINGMEGKNPSWKVLWLRVDALDAQGRAWKILDCMVEKWLDVKEGHAPVMALPTPRPFPALDDPETLSHPTATLTSL